MKQAIWACVGALMAVSGAFAEENESAFKHTLSLGATLTDGNSETLSANGSWLSEGEKEHMGSVRLGLEGNYGESTTAGIDEKTVENAKAFANAKKTLTDMMFGSIEASVAYDDIAEIDYRAILSPGLGSYLVKDETAQLFVEAGPAYIWEKVAGVDDDYLALRIAERIDFAVSATAKVWQSLEYLPTADDFDDYLLNAEIGAEAAMSEKLNLRLVLQNKYDSTPADGLEENDLSLVAGISVHL